MDNLESVHSYYRAVDSDDVETLLDLFAADAVYCRPGYQPLRGRAEIEAFYRGTRVIASGAHTLTTEVVGEGAIAVNGTFNGVLKDGSTQQLRFADFFTFDDQGRFATRDTFFFAPMV